MPCGYRQPRCWLATMLLLAAGVSGCVAPRPALRLADTTIDDRQVWSGTVTIRGAVTVKKAGSLLVLPGTRIAFERFDGDGDGIGDGELLVEGELVARGTASEPIVFTSAAATPRAADWKFLYFDYARRAELVHVVSEYAYSGVQIHFCKARVVDSVFRYNIDGVRFSTANVEVAGNRIHDNTHGIRFEERRGSGSVHDNDLRDNDIGIFVVTRAESRTRFAANNIVSRNYNVKLGLEQSGDVSFPGNWWGSGDPGAIRQTFFDQQSDPALGRVLAPEPLLAPMELRRGQTE